MFSYRHAFHAGNHADVLKHIAFIQVLRYFQQKPAPYWIIDTHAGAGLYDLRSDWAQKNTEFNTGITKLLQASNSPTEVQAYIDFIQSFNTETIQFYPGSPWIAMGHLRPKDRLRLFEWHPSEQQALQHLIDCQEKPLRRQIQLFHQNGFESLKALLPPPTRRALVLMDPAYENKRDYQFAYRSLCEALRRFPSGTYILWYPLVQRPERNEMLRQLCRLPQDWLHLNLSIQKAPQGDHGLYGSGLFIINPPYTMAHRAREWLPFLAQHLGIDGQGHYHIEAQAH